MTERPQEAQRWIGHYWSFGLRASFVMRASTFVIFGVRNRQRLRLAVQGMPRLAARSRDRLVLFVRDYELVEAKLVFARIADALEQLFHQAAEAGLADGIIVVLAVAPRLDQAGHPQQGQVMADGRLALSKPITQSRDVQLGF